MEIAPAISLSTIKMYDPRGASLRIFGICPFTTNYETSAGGQRLPSSNGSSSHRRKRSSDAPSAKTKRQGAVHAAGGFTEDQSQFRLPAVRVARISISGNAGFRPMFLVDGHMISLSFFCYPPRHLSMQIIPRATTLFAQGVIPCNITPGSLDAYLVCT